MKVACLYFKSQIPLSSVAEVFLKLSPQISLGHSALFIEIGKCHRLYSEQGFQARCQAILKRLNLFAQIAIATDVSEAFVKAKYQCNDINQLPLMSLSDFADPFEKDEKLRKNVFAMVAAFQHLGVVSIGQFKKIPLSELISRFGAVSILCVQRLRKEVEIPWPFWKPVEIVVEKNDFPYFEFYGELEPVLFKLKEQLDRIFHRLWGRDLCIQKLQVRIFFESNSLHPAKFRHFEFDFISPQSQTKSALNIIKERLAKDFDTNPVQTPIEGLETQVLITCPASSKQKNLLHNHEEQMEQLNAILAQLTEAHGSNHIFFAELTEDRRPEKSWKKNMQADQSKKNSSVNILEKIPLRPTQLLRTPLKVQLIDGYIYIQRKKFKIKHWPQFSERISGSWFSEFYDREYFHIELEEAPDISVFRDKDQFFYLHGYFG